MVELEENILSSLDKSVRFFVLPVLRTGVGSGLGRCKIFDVQCGSRCTDNEPHGDRFNCIVPYCGINLLWQIIFDIPRLHLGPDVIVDGDGSNGFKPKLQDIPALCKWDPHDSCSLVNVINQLLDCYRQYSLQLINAKMPAAATQIELLDSMKLVSKFDVLSITPSSSSDTNSSGQERTPIAIVFVPLSIDLSLLPSYLISANLGSSRANLQLTYYEPENNPLVGARLDLSPQLLRAFQGIPLTLPSWATDGYGSVHEYVPNIRMALLDKVEQICESFARRRDFVLAFCSAYGRGLLEFDSEAFKKFSFIVVSPVTRQSHALHFIVTVDLSPQFPNICPVFTLKSVYHRTAKGGPVVRVFENGYPYSPRWHGDEMAERARLFLKESTVQFAMDLMPSGGAGSAGEARYPVVC
eukprot:scpid59425/ scgid16357/ BRCA1-A complex subunit BRE; BRCA1/BRCA2-containing complex subunit 45; Brain and reproductive organ-expressed protein